MIKTYEKIWLIDNSFENCTALLLYDVEVFFQIFITVISWTQQS